MHIHVTNLAFFRQINAQFGIFIYNQDFFIFRGIIGSPKANNTFQIISDFQWSTEKSAFYKFVVEI